MGMKVNGATGDAGKMILRLKEDTSWALTIKRPIETPVVIPLKNEVSLGLNLKYAPSGTSLLIVSVDKGPMDDWNKANPKSAVKKNDRIVQVNGVRGLSEQLVNAAHSSPKGPTQDSNVVLDMVILQYDDAKEMLRRQNSKGSNNSNRSTGTIDFQL